MRALVPPAMIAAAILWMPHGLAIASGAATDAGSASQSSSQVQTKGGSNSLPVSTDGLKSGCFYAREVSNWETLNRDYLIVYAPNKSRSFLVFFSPPSFEIRSAVTIGFEGRDRICGRPGERLVIGRGAGKSFTIMDVWQLNAAAADRLLENKKSRDTGKVEAGDESPGAELETDIGTAGGAESSDSHRTDEDAVSEPD